MFIRSLSRIVIFNKSYTSLNYLRKMQSWKQRNFFAEQTELAARNTLQEAKLTFEEFKASKVEKLEEYKKNPAVII